MNGKFELEMTHKLDSALKKDVGYITFNPVAVELTRIAIENKMSTDEILNIFKKIQRGLLE